MVKIIGDYTLTCTIGQGQYGKVYKALHSSHKHEVAIKCIPISKFQEIPKLTDGMRNEIETLKLLQDNPHIVKFLQTIKTVNNIYMVYEYCEGGTLDEWIRAKGYLKEREALLMMRELMSAFRVLSEHSVYHRDIKPDNILIKEGGLKLADFGFCKKMATLDDLTQTVLGSPIYMAPEILNGDLYNSKSDVWSLGVVLYQMLFGVPPFGQGSLSDLLDHVSNFELKIPSTQRISFETENLLRRMLTKEHFRRISWQDFFYEYDIDVNGSLLRKDKGFEYDLMKLMKKNSSKTSPTYPPKKQPKLNINWDTITDRKSSIRSEELESYHKGCDIDKLLHTKKQLKELFLVHTKCHQASMALMEVLRKRYCDSSDQMGYLIATIIKTNFQNLPSKVTAFKKLHQNFLQSNPNDADKLRKLQLVLFQQKSGLLSKINKLRLSLISHSKEQLIKLSDKKAVRQCLNEYLGFLKAKYPVYDTFEESEVNKDISVHAIRVLSAVNFDSEREVLNVNEGVSKIKLAKMLHKRKRDLDL